MELKDYLNQNGIVFEQDGVKVSAGCFQGNIDEFCTAVDEKYSGKQAREYKKQARACVSELGSEVTA